MTTSRSARSAGFRSILCPIDFSADSGRALVCADALARRWGGRLSILYAIDPMLASAAATALNDRTLPQRSAEEMRGFVLETLGSTPRPAIKYISRVGRVAKEVLDTARTVRADLIVMGTHGLTGPSKILIGSTTAAVLHHTKVPVLAIPSLDVSNWKMHADWPGARIVAAIDFNSRAADVAARAERIASWFGATLVLAHVVAELRVPAWMDAALIAHDRVRLQKARSVLEDLAGSVKKTRTPVEFRVVSGKPAAEIAALLDSERAGLVITALDKAGWFGQRRGSVSYDVLAHATAPVLALPR